MKITKELKGIAKRADYAFIRVDNYKAQLELLASKDSKGDHYPTHIAMYDGIPCDFHDYANNNYSGYNGKAKIYIDTYQAETLLSLLQVLHVDTEIGLEVNACGNSQVQTEAGLVFDTIYLIATKNLKPIGKFLIMASCGKNNCARPIQYN